MAEEITRGTITPKALSRYLGPARYKSDPDLAEDDIGCANGLAWTSVGGEVLVVEASLMKGKGNLILTGQLGDVMKESVRAALTFLRSHGDEFGVAEDALEEKDLHIHVPAGATNRRARAPSFGMTLTESAALVRLPP